MPPRSFFSLDLRQQVNQWMCIALVSVMCFWVVLNYFVQKTEAFGNNYIYEWNQVIQAAGN
ncbi:MAG: hypothetical protein WCV82_01380 [Candidatus Paceibacterota bacterium]